MKIIRGYYNDVYDDVTKFLDFCIIEEVWNSWKEICSRLLIREKLTGCNDWV